MKKFPLFLIALFFLAQASALQITPEYPTNIIVRDFDNSISLTLEITNASTGTYNIYTLADIIIRPSETFQINDNHFEKTFTIKPNDNLDFEGNYAFTYTLNQRGVEKHEQKMLLRILNLEDIIEISSESIDPTSNQVSFYIQNKEQVHLKNITATFSSVLFDITTTFDLKPNEKFVIPVNVEESKLAKTTSGVYIISSKFQTDKGEKTIEGTLYLGEKKGITLIEDKSGLLIKTETVTKVNSGNVIESVQISLDRNIFSRLFTSFNIEPALTQRDGMTVKYTWIKERLTPTESYTVKAKTNYVLPFLIIVVFILAVLGYSRFSETKLEVRKSVTPVKTKGGEFALKVSLSLKARQEVENVTLTDKIPAIVKIYKKFGTLKPDRIDTESRRIQWNIGDLEAGEERSFSYIVYSKVGIVGKFSLPRALAVFEKEGHIHEIDSNNVFFMNEQANE
jgi:hypothetical protein